VTHSGDVISPGAVADLVARLRRAMRRAARARQPAIALSVAQLELLSLVQERPGARPGDLAETLRVAPNSVSTLTQSLVGAGMLRKVQDGNDRRVVQIWPTALGLDMVALWRVTNNALLEAALTRMQEDDQQLLARALPALDRLIALIDEQTDLPPEVNDDVA